MVFYFTGSGNSLFAARQLAGSEELISIGACLRQGKSRFEVQGISQIGLVLPVYFFGLPAAVQQFLSNLELLGLSESTYVYALLTCGGISGNAGKQLQQALQKRGITLHAEFGLRSVDNYLPLFHLPSAKKQSQIQAAAKSKLLEIKALIQAKKLGNFNDCRGCCPSLLTFLLYRFYRRSRRTAKFSVSSACIGCGLCAEICPEQAIAMQEKKPLWRSATCSLCLACLHRCPSAAIDFGRGTKNKKRYVHPEAGF